MSGGSRRSDVGGERGGNSVSNDCLNVDFTTNLFSPVASVVSGLTKGEVLDVVFDTKSSTIQAVTSSDDIAGTILGKKTAGLAACLEAGHEYIATVVSIDGGNCRLKIQNK